MSTRVQCRIDDGSTDRSGRLADGHAGQDWTRVRVIHTEKRGSAAENREIEEVVAEWLTEKLR